MPATHWIPAPIHDREGGKRRAVGERAASRRPRLARAGRRLLAAALRVCAVFLAPGVPCAADGRIEPGLAWCGNVINPADYANCRAAGFDAIRLDVPWTAAPSWKVTDALVEHAGQQGLKVILALQTAAPPASFGLVDADNEAYVTGARQWIRDVVEHYRDNPAVLGWMVSDEPETALRLTDAGFRAYLQRTYGDLAPLNAAWGSRYSRFADITASGALILARPRALGLCRAGTDLALFRQQSFVDLMQLWARSVRASDDRRPLFTGAMGAYRCLISVPGDYDAVVARVGATALGGPGGGEAVAIARRSGAFSAVASLPAGDILGAFGDAVLHGAAGIAVEDWTALSRAPAVRDGLAAALANWRRAGCLNAVPRPTAAILYEPFGESALAPSRTLAGYLAGSDTGELETLFATFRRGTAFGQVGFLAREDLTSDRLAQYRVLFCPVALSITSEDVHTLFRFAEAGGVVVADVGFGSYQAGGDAHSWSVELATLLGVRALWPAMPGGGNLRVYDKLSLFPSIAAGATSAAIGGQPAFTELAAMIQPLVGSTVFGASLDRTLPDRKLFGGIVAHPVGKGWVLYASMKLWHRWSPLDPLYVAFHRDLLSRQPAVVLKGAPLFPEEISVAAFARGLAVRNSGSRAELATVYAPGDDLYAGACVNVCRPGIAEQSREVYAGLAPGTLGTYERTPIRCASTRGPISVAVEEYGPAGIRIAVCGGRPNISLTEKGTAVMTPAAEAVARIEVGDGRYPIRAGSRHLLRVKEQGCADVRQFQVLVGPTGRIEMDKTFYCDVLTLTPLAAAAGAPTEAGVDPARSGGSNRE